MSYFMILYVYAHRVTNPIVSFSTTFTSFFAKCFICSVKYKYGKINLKLSCLAVYAVHMLVQSAIQARIWEFFFFNSPYR